MSAVRPQGTPAPMALALCLWAFAGTARGQEVPLTLADAIMAADRQNPEVLAARERALAQEARAEGVRGGRRPRLSLFSGWSLTDDPTAVFANKLSAGEFEQEDFAVARLNDPGSIAHLATGVGLEVPLDIFGKIKDIATAQIATGRAATASAREAALEVRLRVIETYRRAALSQGAVDATERALTGARAREADMASRVEEGASLQAELLRARTRRRQREADLADARGAAAVAEATLTRLLGAEPGTIFRPVDSPPGAKPLIGDEATWIARGLRDRAAIQEAAERLEAHRLTARREGRGLLPDLLAYGRLQDDRNSFSGGGQSYAVGIGVRWTPIDPGRGRREAAAQAELHAAEHDARAAADQVRLETASAYRRAEAARARWAAAAGGAEEGREALRVLRERRQAGLATLTDELETEAASLAAELQELQAAAETAIADAHLDRAVGGGERALANPGAAPAGGLE